MHKACHPVVRGGGVPSRRQGRPPKSAKVPTKDKGKRRELVVEMAMPGPSRPAKHAREYGLDLLTDLESDEMASAVRAVGKVLEEMGEWMKEFGKAVGRIAEVLNKHDL
jgi:hypothetical protein